MKVRTLSALAGAASAFVIASSASAVPTIFATQNVGVAPAGYQSWTVRINGFAAGDTLAAFIGNAARPWEVSTTAGSFWNLAGVFTDGATPTPNVTFDGDLPTAATAAATNNAAFAAFDSGLVAGPLTNPLAFTTGLGNFGRSSVGTSEVLQPAAWFSSATLGVAIPAAGIGAGTGVALLRLTFLLNNTATVGFEIAQNQPPPGASFPVAITFGTVIPAPGAMALLGLAGLVGTRRRRTA